MKKVLIVAAHPDDEIFGMGGTICALTEQGIEVSLLIVTDGSSSQYRDDPRLDDTSGHQDGHRYAPYAWACG